MKKNLEKVNYKNFTDNRGSFNKFFGTKELSIKNFRIKEINFVNNLKKYTFRGFHYQREPFNETKLVTVLSGSIIDFGLNLDKKSKYFGKIFQRRISSKSKFFIKIPNNYAHGYFTLEDKTSVLYFSDNIYNKKKEISISCYDKKIRFKFKNKIKFISDKDRNASNLLDLF